jgi:chromosome segregation ATPase
VHELLNERREAFSEALEDLLRLSELEAEVRELRYLLGRAEGRLELAKGIESALRAEQEGLQEELARERERADKLKGAQEEADRLREELEAERSKGFWQRLFGRA